MVKKKICMLGAFNVGKTSLVKRYVHSIFEEKYQVTIGVKVDKKTVEIGDQTIEFLLWDIAGEDDRFTVPLSYLRGASAYLLVVDGTRKATFDHALDLQRRTEEAIGKVPFIIVLNKADLTDSWEIEQLALDELDNIKWTYIKTSAKLGDNVNEVFYRLGQEIISNPQEMITNL
jgi:small GTP-binding protein